MPLSDYCICTVVAAQALESLLEAAREPSAGEREGLAPRMKRPGPPGAVGRGMYRDSHPWLVARELLDQATNRGERMPVMFAVEPSAGEREGHAPRTNEPLRFSHWALVRAIEVQELHKGAWETRCTFEPPEPVNPIWEPLDSVVLAPSAEQLHREAVEPVRRHRQLLDASLIHPYAVCETPAFIDRARSSDCARRDALRDADAK